MIFECDAPRLAIHISLGHRNNSFFFSKIHKTSDLFVIGFDPVGQKSENKNLSLYRQEVPDIHFDRCLVLVFATRDLQNDMFC